MRHTAIVITPPGTPLSGRTVGEIVAERPSCAHVFDTCGIDLCCQGKWTLREACAIKGIPIQWVLDQLETDTSERMLKSESNPDRMSPGELTKYIVETHHAYLRSELPRLLAMSEQVSKVHGGQTDSLVEVYWIYCAMVDELIGHLDAEEQILFPAIQALCAGEAAAISLDGPVAAMLQDHDDAGDTLAWIRKLTNGFTAPPHACNTQRALFAGLAELEENMHRHIQLENSVLFPQALALSKAG